MSDKRHGHDGGATEDRDSIAEALRAAGPRESLLELDLESLSAPARDAWLRRVEQGRAQRRKVERRRELTRRRRRRLGFVAAAAVVLLALGLFFSGRLSSEIPVGTVIARADGNATAAESGPDMRLTIGSELRAGQRLVTAAGEWLTVELRTGHRLRLDAGTELRIDGVSRVELESGRVYVEAAPAELRLLAKGAQIEHVGTSYMVSLVGGELGVQVREGRVQVVEGARRLEIERGRELREERGEWQVRPAPTHGEAWSWTRRAAPPFESDGAELGRFLDWVEAETGWQVRVAPALLLDDRGEPVRIRGTVDDASPEKALEIVLAGAGLRHRLDGDRLWIEPVDPVRAPP